MPKIEVRPKRVGGSIFQVPQEVKSKRQLFLAARWILDSARAKK
jgi:small subunit ribosomal protein S7